MKHLNEIELVMALDGEMEPAELALAREHVSECGECAHKFEAVRAVSARVVEYQQNLYSGKALAADERRLTLIKGKGFFSWNWGFAVVAAVVALIVVGVARFGVSHPVPQQSADNGGTPKLGVVARESDAASRQTNPAAKSAQVGHPTTASASNTKLGKSSKTPKQTPPVVKPDTKLAFTELPFSDTSLPLTDATVVRVQLPAAALRQAGVPVNEDSANAMLQADVLLGIDGLPRGIRLVKNSSTVVGTN